MYLSNQRMFVPHKYILSNKPCVLLSIRGALCPWSSRTTSTSFGWKIRSQSQPKRNFGWFNAGDDDDDDDDDDDERRQQTLLRRKWRRKCRQKWRENWMRRNRKWRPTEWTKWFNRETRFEWTTWSKPLSNLQMRRMLQMQKSVMKTKELFLIVLQLSNEHCGLTCEVQSYPNLMDSPVWEASLGRSIENTYQLRFYQIDAGWSDKPTNQHSN